MRPVPQRAGAVLDAARLDAVLARARPGRGGGTAHARDAPGARVRPAVGGGRGGVLRAGRGVDRGDASDRALLRAPRGAARAATPRAGSCSTASARTCKDGKLAGLEAAGGEPVPAQPAARAPAHPAHRSGRSVGSARRGRRDARPPQAGDAAVSAPISRAVRRSTASSAACGWSPCRSRTWRGWSPPRG